MADLDSPQLIQRTRCSFDSSHPGAVAALLLRHGYGIVDTRSRHEFARLRKGGALAVIYHSGAVLAQGGDPQSLIRLLELAADQAEAVTR